jgi:hypothetical protein
VQWERQGAVATTQLVSREILMFYCFEVPLEEISIEQRFYSAEQCCGPCGAGAEEPKLNLPQTF